MELNPEHFVIFQGSLSRLTTDRDGESKVTFEIPLSALESVIQLSKWSGKVLTVYVKVEKQTP